MNCLNYNCNDVLGVHLPIDCGDYPLGGIDAVIVLACDHQLTDPESTAQINAEITAGRAWLIENIKVSITEPSPITVANPVACRVDRLVNYDRAGTLNDANVNPENVNFYTTLLSGQSFGGMIYRECGQDRVTWIDKVITFKGGRVVPDNDNDHQMFVVSFDWRAKEEPDIFAEPANIFTA